jgi:hypothetical protein
VPWRLGEENNRLYSPAERAALGEAELPEAEKEKDRVMVRGLPRILARAGYAIARSGAAAVTDAERPVRVR